MPPPVLLPSPPSDPLHLLPALLPWVLMVLGVLAFGWLWLMLRDAGEAVAETEVEGSPQPPPAPSSIEARIAALLEFYLGTEEYREGCHVLASLIRSHLERRTGVEVEAMTSDEIGQAVDDRSLAELMTDLRGHQYRRRPPARADFTSMCSRATSLLGAVPSRGRRPAA